MKKRTLIMAAVMSVVFAFSGCAKNGGATAKEPVDPVTPSPTVEVEGTVHEYDVKDGSTDFLKDGASEYIIVYPADATSLEKTAVDEFNAFLGMAANGLTLRVETDTGKVFSESDKVVSIGRTTLYESAALGVDLSELGESGFIMKTKGDTLFLTGEGEYGTLYSVYEFFTQMFNYEIYNEDTIVIDKNVENRKMKVFDVKDIPDIQINIASFGYVINNEQLRNRMRYRHDSLWLSPGGNAPWHNFFVYIPKEEYLASHPEWFSGRETGSSSSAQLCLTAHGDPESREEMIDVFVSKIIKAAKENPQNNRITVTHMDSNEWCNCEHCTASLNKYGTDAALMVQFANDISRKVKAVIAESTDPDLMGREIDICFFAYYRTTEAPVSGFDETTGEYIPVDETVRCDDGVYVFCATYNASWMYSFLETQNYDTYEMMNQWRDLSDKYYLWTYCVFFRDYMLPLNSFNSMADNYKFFKQCNADYLFNQGQHNQNGASTGWSDLKNYLGYKLAWNVNLDINELIDDYFENVYREAAPAMRDYFESFCTWTQTMVDETGIDYRCNIDITNSVYWPKNIVAEWKADIDEAVDAIAEYKLSDPELYESLYNHIRLERISVDYMLLKYYANSLDNASELAKEFKSDCTKFGMSNASEQNSINSLYTQFDY